jgi:hypothetical protein
MEMTAATLTEPGGKPGKASIDDTGHVLAGLRASMGVRQNHSTSSTYAAYCLGS